MSWAGRDKNNLRSTPGHAQGIPKSHTVCPRALSKCFFNSHSLGAMTASLESFHSRVVEPHGAFLKLHLYPAYSLFPFLGWEHSQRAYRARHSCSLEEGRFTRCRRKARWEIITGAGVNGRSNPTAQKRIWGIGLKVPVIFQKLKARPYSSHLYGSWTCKNQLPYKNKNKTQTIWKRTSDPRFMLAMAVTLNHWVEPLVCWKVWMWTHPSFSDYCSYSQRLWKLNSIIFAMLDPISGLWKQLSNLQDIGGN